MISSLRIPRINLSRALHPQGKKTIILASILLLVAAVLGYEMLQKTMTIAVDGHTVEIKTFKGTVGQAITSAGVTLNPEDIVMPSVEQKTHGGMTIKVTRAVPVTISFDGQQVKMKTARPLVRDLVDQAGVTLGEKDRVEPSPESPISPDLNVKVIRVREDILTFDHTIAYRVERRENNDMDEGTERTLQKGEEGLREEKVKVVYENGQEVTRTTVSDLIVKEKKDELIEYGTVGVVVASRGESIRYTRSMSMVATGYSAYDATTINGSGRTATGVAAKYGVVAVDPRVIPLHTQLYIEGYGYAVAGDTGGAIKGERIDLCFNSHEEALNYGRRWVNVYVVK